MSNIEFKAWPKTPRLFRDCVITEKIDGTNSAIHVFPIDPAKGAESYADGLLGIYELDEAVYGVAAQSRNRMLSLSSDNYGFAQFVSESPRVFFEALGVGVHYGEWWGGGIQRGYGLKKDDKRFSLFNVQRYGHVGTLDLEGVPLSTVPVLYTGPFRTSTVHEQIDLLKTFGSVAVEGFMNPEGVITWHSASRSVYKTTVENDESPKSI